MRASTSASQACGSTSLSLAVWMSVYMRAVRSAPRSDPANNHDFLPRAKPRRARSAALLKGMVPATPLFRLALEQVVRTKGRIHAILRANLIPKYSGHLFGKAGKKWLAGLPLPEEEKAIVGRLVDELERNSDQLAKLDMTIIGEALENPRVVRLMTIPGIGPVVASTVLASIGDISRFETPEKLSCYFGLTPKVRQSGDRPARHGRISKQGNTHARKMLVEAAWSAKTAPGPLKAFFQRVQRNRGAPAAAVATARKLAVMIWHVLTDGTEYVYARPAFTAMKLRKAALKAGAPREYGKAGPGRDYWIKEIREREADYVRRAEQAYERMVAAWKERPPMAPAMTAMPG